MNAREALGTGGVRRILYTEFESTSFKSDNPASRAPRTLDVAGILRFRRRPMSAGTALSVAAVAATAVAA
jgi:hypothetical protein